MCAISPQNGVKNHALWPTKHQLKINKEKLQPRKPFHARSMNDSCKEYE